MTNPIPKWKLAVAVVVSPIIGIPFTAILCKFTYAFLLLPHAMMLGLGLPFILSAHKKGAENLGHYLYAGTHGAAISGLICCVLFTYDANFQVGIFSAIIGFICALLPCWGVACISWLIIFAFRKKIRSASGL